jgi:hypothetical protein
VHVTLAKPHKLVNDSVNASAVGSRPVTKPADEPANPALHSVGRLSLIQCVLKHHATRPDDDLTAWNHWKTTISEGRNENAQRHRQLCHGRRRTIKPN